MFIFSTIAAVRAALSGMKTIIIGVLMIAVALVESPLLGWDIPNVEVSGNWFEMMLAGGAFITTRTGIAKVTRDILANAK